MYCFNCMKEADSRAICPHCHKQNVPDRIPHHLAPGTVLNGQYIVGNSLGEGGFGVTYVGRDTKLQMRVAVKEYYPLGKVSRDNSRDNNVYTATQEQSEFFKNGKKRFLREAQIIARFSGEKGVVNIGSVVTLLEEGEDEPEEYTIVGTHEADPMNNRISFLSPIGAAIHKRKQGETVTVETPGGTIRMKIVKVQ